MVSIFRAALIWLVHKHRPGRPLLTVRYIVAIVSRLHRYPRSHSRPGRLTMEMERCSIEKTLWNTFIAMSRPLQSDSEDIRRQTRAIGSVGWAWARLCLASTAKISAAEFALYSEFDCSFAPAHFSFTAEYALCADWCMFRLLLIYSRSVLVWGACATGTHTAHVRAPILHTPFRVEAKLNELQSRNRFNVLHERMLGRWKFVMALLHALQPHTKIALNIKIAVSFV